MQFRVHIQYVWSKKIKLNYADMAKLADAHGSGPCVSRHASSSLAICTKYSYEWKIRGFLILQSLNEEFRPDQRDTVIAVAYIVWRACSNAGVKILKE